MADAVHAGQDLLPVLKSLENSEPNAVSRKGAMGTYQIMPGTARGYGYEPQDMLDPQKNEEVATRLVNDLWKRYNGNIQDVLVAWNGNPRMANRWIASGRTGWLPRETRSFLSRASQYLQVNNQPMRAPLGAPPSDLEPGAIP